MRVMKFGGPVLRDNSGFERMAAIVKNYNAGPLLIVVSAFSTATREIERAMRTAVEGQEVEAKNVLSDIMQQHRHFSRNLLQDAETQQALYSLLDETERILGNIVRGLTITRELTSRTLDVAMSYGEYCAVHIVRHYLQEQGLVVSFADATELIVTDDHHLAATPLYEATECNVREKLLPLLEPGKVVLTQGFVGRTINGEVSTMGRESSNFTAALLGELTGANEVVIWTDVVGIRSTDPKLTNNTRLIPQLSYAQAFIAANNGVKPLDPAMVEPVRRAGIPLEFRSAFEPDAGVTTIAAWTNVQPLPIISVVRDVVIVTLQFTSASSSLHKQEYVALLFPRPETVLSVTFRTDTLGIVALRSAISHQSFHLPDDCTVSVHEDYDVLLALNLSPEQIAYAQTICMQSFRITGVHNHTHVEFTSAGAVTWICTPQFATIKILHELHARLIHPDEH